MKPKKLTLCGWGPYKSIEEVDFTVFEEKGTFLITGSTGSGKTTIFDAISYALYGALSGDERDKERSSTRSDFAEGDVATYVELTMEHGGAIYHIRRNPEYMRPKKRSSGKAAFTKEKENAILTYPDGRVLEGVREVNAALKELLVLDYQQFKKISMIAQGEFARLLVAPPREKTKIFREIFGTTVFDRFTQELGARARAAYAKVSEQRAKLEEDVRHLTVGLDKSSWSEEIKQELWELTGAENRNYDAIVLCLEKMLKEAKEKLKAAQKTYESADKEVENLATKLAGMEEENSTIRRFLRAKEDLEQLRAKAEEYTQKQERYTRAMNAGWAEGAEAKLIQAKQQIEKNRRQSEVLMQREEEGREQLKRAQQRFLQQEELCRQVKAEYEEAEHRRRLDAIGLAVELLEEGKPCPVCGSISHPAPAVSKDEMLSEQVLKEMKQKVEQAQQKRTLLHGEALAQKTKLESLEEQRKQLAEEQARAEETGLAAEQEFLEILCQYGFEDAQSYDRAKLTRAERENLRQEIEAYGSKKAAAEELYGHLQESIRSTELLDLGEVKSQLSAARLHRDEVLKSQKLWESSQNEVKKTSTLILEKLDKIGKESEEYGYVKDLENMATGNNPKRLVFEQYVLAGYFEEILRAANLRFAKMTGGRYEMSRLQEVGDGRVKDNLEIQVIDYYTGKCRSVRTLSGGESFKASLSLALGMSDVIQAMNGGIKVDTLFVDEGFGSLDEESLDQACSTLMSLAEKKHLIGIISHVPQLRERIDNQLIIEKTGNGSRIKTRI